MLVNHHCWFWSHIEGCPLCVFDFQKGVTEEGRLALKVCSSFLWSSLRLKRNRRKPVEHQNPSLLLDCSLGMARSLLLLCACLPCQTVTPQTAGQMNSFLSCFCQELLLQQWEKQLILWCRLTWLHTCPLPYQMFCSPVLWVAFCAKGCSSSGEGKRSVPSEVHVKEHHVVQPFTK